MEESQDSTNGGLLLTLVKRVSTITQRASVRVVPLAAVNAVRLISATPVVSTTL
jgi:hypothetical protein